MRNPKGFGWYIHKLGVATAGAVIGFVLFIGALIVATQSHADPFSVNDAAYLSTLHDSNVVVPGHSDDAFLLQLGHAVCSDLLAGNSEPHVFYDLHSQGITFADAGTITGAAEAAYCPVHHAGTTA